MDHLCGQVACIGRLNSSCQRHWRTGRSTDVTLVVGETYIVSVLLLQLSKKARDIIRGMELWKTAALADAQSLFRGIER